jgi:hypothetical protein
VAVWEGRLIRVRLCILVVAVLLGGGVERAGAAVPRFSAPVQMHVGANPAQIVAADLNRDGRPDLVTADYASSTVSVLLGRGDGSFKRRTVLRTPKHPVGIVAADVDGDGRPDLVSESDDGSGSIQVFANRRRGRFKPTHTYASGSRAYAVAAADVNHDGRLDVVTGHADRRDFAVLLGTGAGRFGVAERYRGPGVTGIALGDLNGDGNLDAVGASGSVVVRLGRGDGTFGPSQPVGRRRGPFNVAVADLNGDRILDVAAANYDDSSVSLLLGAGDGAFPTDTRYPMGENPFEDIGLDGVDPDAALVADLDRDGHVDLAAPTFSGPVVRIGNGDGTFGKQRHVWHQTWFYLAAGAVADFDRDGWPDLAFNNACDDIEGAVSCPARSASVLLNWTGRPTPPCVVPRIVHRTLRAARRMLRRAGCRLGHVRRSSTQQAKKPTVLTQHPRPWAVLRSHARVGVIVTR